MTLVAAVRWSRQQRGAEPATEDLYRAWRQFWAIFTVIVAFGLSLGGSMFTSHSDILTDIKSSHAEIRADIGELRSYVLGVVERVARIEGRLEITVEPE